ncbi:hypothetical protein AH332_01195 [Salmonella enterica subsp. salamae]|nr:hypothetical protein [Salmonella enterica subsp. salamae]EDW4019627.1 hypothetical protein [Salmonella enterica subsp. salamae]
MKMKLIPFYLSALFSASSWATEINACKDLIGTWKIMADNPPYTMTILPPVESCGEKCVKLNVQYELDVTHHNALYCHEGQEGVKGQGPMVIAFEGAYGGHAIGTYNRQLQLLWAGVIPKNKQGKWVMKMENYWFKQVKAH